MHDGAWQRKLSAKPPPAAAWQYRISPRCAAALASAAVSRQPQQRRVGTIRIGRARALLRVVRGDGSDMRIWSRTGTGMIGR
jgi:hypothetical protein